VYKPKVSNAARILQYISTNIKGRQYTNVTAGSLVMDGVIKCEEDACVLRGLHMIFDGWLKTAKNVKISMKQTRDQNTACYLSISKISNWVT
jgi:hypothetical protein